MLSEHEVDRVAERLSAAIVSGDVETQRRVFDPGFTVWHNTDGRDKPLDGALAHIADLSSRVASMAYEDVRRTPTATGYVQQATIRGTSRLGEPYAVDSCIVVQMGGDGRVVRVAEYQDSAAMAPVMRVEPSARVSALAVEPGSGASQVAADEVRA